MSTSRIARRRALGLTASAATAFLTSPALAQPKFPTKPIRLLVGYQPGGLIDSVMRVAAAEAAKRLGQPIVIDNRPGASGVVSFIAIKNAPPDGYTIGNLTLSLWRQPILGDAGYDALKDFTYLLNMFDTTFAVLVSAESPFKTWADLLEYGRRNPTKISYGAIPGLGQSAHLFMQEVTAKERIQWEPVGFKGSPDGVTSLFGGHITFLVDTVVGTNAFVRAGKARYLAVASASRLKSWPEVPRMSDLGYDLLIDSPNGLCGPAGLPAAVAKTLHDAFKFAIEQPSVIELLAQSDQRVRYMSAEALTEFVAKSSIEQRELLQRYGLAAQQ